MPLDGGRVLVIVVGTGGHISHKVIEPSDDYDQTELQQAANYLNSEFKGQSLLQVRQIVLDRLREERTLYDVLLARALRLASSTFADIDSAPTLFVQGASLLLDDVSGEDPELTLEALRTLLGMIEEKTRLLQLLDDYISADGLTIVIGSEHNAPDLQRFSLVVSELLRRAHGPRRRRHRAEAHALLEGDQRRRLIVEGHQPAGQLETLTSLAEHGLPRSLSTTSHGRQPHEYRRRPDVGERSGGNTRSGGRRRRRGSSVSVTSTTIGCCGRQRSSTTTANASTASGRPRPRQQRRTSCRSCCRSSTTSSAR